LLLVEKRLSAKDAKEREVKPQRSNQKSAEQFRHREERSDVAIQEPLISLAFWIASLRSQ